MSEGLYFSEADGDVLLFGADANLPISCTIIQRALHTPGGAMVPGAGRIEVWTDDAETPLFNMPAEFNFPGIIPAVLRIYKQALEEGKEQGRHEACAKMRRALGIVE